MKTTMTRIGRALILNLLLVSTGLFATDGDSKPSRAQLALDDLRSFTDVFNQVRNNFVEEVDDHTLMNAAIRGMLSDLDPHSSYMEADEFRQLDNSSRGRYSGIGVEVIIRDGRIVVVSVTAAGPAYRAGVVDGDIITAIDGRDLRGSHLPAAIENLRGKTGTEVAVTFEHEDGEVTTFTLVRDYVDIASVFSRPVDGDYGYFRISHFTHKSADELQQQIASMQDHHAGPLLGIVVDLRGNPGGVLKPAVTMADGFLDHGKIVYTSGRAANQLEYSAKAGQWLAGVAMVVLVDRATASASEVLAGALQDHGRALIVGERTFGKGSVQSVLNLRNGAGLRLTTSRYYTPSGRSIQAEGIRPDIEITAMQAVKDTDSRKREVDLDRHLNGEPETAKPRVFDSEVNATDDYALYQALMLLKGANKLSAASGQ